MIESPRPAVFHASANPCEILPIILNMLVNIFSINSTVFAPVPFSHTVYIDLPISDKRLLMPLNAYTAAAIIGAPNLSHDCFKGWKNSATFFLISSNCLSTSSSGAVILSVSNVSAPMLPISPMPPEPPPEPPEPPEDGSLELLLELMLLIASNPARAPFNSFLSLEALPAAFFNPLPVPLAPLESFCELLEALFMFFASAPVLPAAFLALLDTPPKEELNFFDLPPNSAVRYPTATITTLVNATTYGMHELIAFAIFVKNPAILDCPIVFITSDIPLTIAVLILAIDVAIPPVAFLACSSND